MCLSEFSTLRLNTWDFFSIYAESKQSYFVFAGFVWREQGWLEFCSYRELQNLTNKHFVTHIKWHSLAHTHSQHIAYTMCMDYDLTCAIENYYACVFFWFNGLICLNAAFVYNIIVLRGKQNSRDALLLFPSNLQNTGSIVLLWGGGSLPTH